jgi:hypothetical protein
MGETSTVLDPLERANLNHSPVMFPSSGDGETSTVLDPLERANLNHSPVMFPSSGDGGDTYCVGSLRKELTSMTRLKLLALSKGSQHRRRRPQLT